jgi:glutamate dehydrogenase/leucine dehydrogenase
MTPPCVVNVDDGGFLAIDSFVGGRSCGGLRMALGVDAAELALLARNMTLKYGFLGLPQGGAKGGVSFDPDAPLEERRRRLSAYAAAIAPLLKSRVFVPMPDMGTNAVEIRHMLRSVAVPVGRRELRGGRSGSYTARGVLVVARAAAAHGGIEWRGARAIIEGFGKVGSELARMLEETGVSVVGVSTSSGALYNPAGLPVQRLLAASAASGTAFVQTFPGAERVAPPRLLELPCDLLFPCARHHSLHRDNAPLVQARLVSPGANSPCTDEAEAVLLRRGVLVLPDFVSNCGGVLGGTMEFAGIADAAIDAFMECRLGQRIAELFSQAEQQRTSVRELATRTALERFDLVRRQEAAPAASQRVFQAGLGLYRRGLIPEQLVGRLAGHYFERLLA